MASGHAASECETAGVVLASEHPLEQPRVWVSARSWISERGHLVRSLRSLALVTTAAVIGAISDGSLPPI